MDELDKIIKELPVKPYDDSQSKLKYNELVKKINNMLIEAVEIKDRKTYLDSSLTFSESLLVITEGLKNYVWENSGMIEVKEKKGNIFITIIKIVLKLLGVKL